MNKNRTKIIKIALIAITTVLAIYGLFTANSLKQKLNAANEEASQMEEKVAEYHELMRIDSLLVDGEYNSAMKAYKEQLNNRDLQDVSGVQLRINIAEKLIQLRTGKRPGQAWLAKKDSLDSIQTARLAGIPNEIKQYDSLSFALEKAKVQLAGMRRQLQKKSFGEYLTFTNKKGSRIHYVGEVKNNRANGYGIALLNTGSRYEGEWNDNQRHGEGSFYWPDGEYYVGSYQNDQRNGQGTYYWPNGEKYIGQWAADKRKGKGIFYGKDNEIVTQGIWDNDKLVKEDK
ncbi:MAG: hypothetical protein WBG90_09855 [Saonia sp.]